MLRPVDVFTPGRIPIRPNNVYSRRGEAETDFEQSLERGMVPLVFGEYGVGKTSLARHQFKPQEAQGVLVNIESVADSTLQDVLDRILEKLDYVVVRKRVDTHVITSSHEQGGDAAIGLAWAKASIASKRRRGESQSSQNEGELIVSSPTDSRVVEICEAAGVALLIDELHRASDTFNDELAKFIKTYGNANCHKFSIALLGTSSDASKLVRSDKGIDRLLQEVHLLSMTSGEANFVVEQGMRALALNISDDVRDRLVRIAVGSPSILQYLCLECAEVAITRDARSVVIDDVDRAVKKFVETKEARLNRAYISAIETTGENRYRKQILRAMAESDDEYVTMDHLTTAVSGFLGKAVPSTSLSGPLRELKTDRFGAVLTDVARPDSTDRMQNYTTFRDPSLKAFIRMQQARSEG
jgi:hypothetical protein